jgi:electron transfer flavoprotein beta subunit
MDPLTRTIIRTASQAVLNPFDAFAVAWAVRLKASCPAETIALSMGIPATEKLLRDCLCRGLDRAVLVTDRAFAGSDTLATAYTLALAVRRLGGADLILCGKMAIDGDTAQTGPELAERLGLPHVTDVFAISDLTDHSVVVQRNLDGICQTLQVRLPALLTLAKDSIALDLPSIASIRRGYAAPCQIWQAGDLAADPGQIGFAGSPTQVTETFTPERKKEPVDLDGDTEEQAEALRRLLAEVLP